ncbi:hypothetical protein GA0074695_2238 [Micromonospora viridifaciens]|uniref:Uncharacterized protein n=1 Tax=Micromonospora viridifaciens TaxID=1881 RepID=A0A1C4WA65_MICVI|nr:hypothetical protein [Micromonospora viridifaciens]SCE93074.1 hypothetical protein GA0074695_2238 [Micromonospora viridifaciens]
MEQSWARVWWPALRRTVAGPDVTPVRPPLERWPRLVRYASLLAVVGLFAATPAEETGRHLPQAVAILFAALTVAPLLTLLWHPLLAWRLTVVALCTCTFNAPPSQAAAVRPGPGDVAGTAPQAAGLTHRCDDGSRSAECSAVARQVYHDSRLRARTTPAIRSPADRRR